MNATAPWQPSELQPCLEKTGTMKTRMEVFA
jgi:hypothetical protein